MLLIIQNEKIKNNHIEHTMDKNEHIAETKAVANGDSKGFDSLPESQLKLL